MGLQFQLYLRKARSTKTLFSTMKAFVAVAMAAAAQAAPEADPQLLLANPAVHVYGNAHTQTMGMVQHANGAVVPDDTLSVKAAKVDHLSAKATAYLNKPLVHTVAQPMYTAGYSGLYNPYFFNQHLIKREAEAEADPQLLLNTPYTAYTTGVHNLAYNGVYNYVPTVAKTVIPTVAKTVVKTPVVAKSVVAPVYSGLYNTNLYNYGVYGAHGLYKREAEAEADPAFYYGNYGYTYPAYTGYTGYSVPAVHSVAKTVVPTVAKTVVQAPVVAKSVVSPFYSALNYPYATYGAGYTHLIKREAEAEAEADPALYYGNYGYGVPAYTAGVYNGYTGYTGLNTYAYNPVYGYNSYGYNRGYLY